ncbi:UNVERIFIED_CONTAM: hypothetical protein Sindi_0042000 [Sesamum indicum]
MSLGHAMKDCAINKVSKPPISVYVQHARPQTVVAASVAPIPPSPAPEVEVAMDDSMGVPKTGNRCDKVSTIVEDYHLHFLGLLETRVQATNAVRIQLATLPRWKWFTDYVSFGNRIWLAWDDELLDVTVMDIGVQYINYRVRTRNVHNVYTITIVYGASDISARRELWQALITLAWQCSEEMWLAGDNRLASDEFNDCIVHTGLLSLPMQGE